MMDAGSSLSRFATFESREGYKVERMKGPRERGWLFMKPARDFDEADEEG